ncbi:uncharacterized protein LOC135386238 [Ornithodoros turicata]|uniref:uncharacterized protein LOC135386238 n=1 Tax=Ornithodoros turicata TaxID=34597 RepID=UPI00313A03A6
MKLILVAFVSCLVFGFVAPKCDNCSLSVAENICLEILQTGRSTISLPRQGLSRAEGHKRFCREMEHLKRCMLQNLGGKGCEAELGNVFQAAEQQAEEDFGISKCDNSNGAQPVTTPERIGKPLIESTVKLEYMEGISMGDKIVQWLVDPAAFHRLVCTGWEKIIVKPQCDKGSLAQTLGICMGILTGPSTRPPVLSLAEGHKQSCRYLEHLKRCMPEQLEGRGCEDELGVFFEEAEMKAKKDVGTSKCDNSNGAQRVTHPAWLPVALVSVASAIKIATF